MKYHKGWYPFKGEDNDANKLTVFISFFFYLFFLIVKKMKGKVELEFELLTHS